MDKKIFLISAITVVLTSCLGPDRLFIDGDILWSQEKQAVKWTLLAEHAVRYSSLLQQDPQDIKLFCHRYKVLKQANKIKFWVMLLSAMTKFESGFNPQAQYSEKFKDQSGLPIVSRGLLQLSIESANQKRYDCQINNEKDLHNAKINLTCGIKILSYWLKKDGVIASVNGKNTGAARYWSVLRPTNKILSKVRKYTQSLKFCNTNI